jgi:protein gp37
VNKTSIEWTDSTWNVLRGCSRVSEGCRNCYAESIAYRFSGERIDGRPAPYKGLVQLTPDGMRLPKWNGQIKFVEEHLLDPLKLKPVLTGIARGDGELRQRVHRDGTVSLTRERARRIFVNSMSDLFHENVTDEWIDQIFAVMALCPQHTFQVLTKRPERMAMYCSDMYLFQRIHEAAKAILGYDYPKRPAINQCDLPLPNVHLGVSCEDQETADKRIPWLLQTPAAVRFISAEPLLGEISLKRIRMPETLYGWIDQNALTGDFFRHGRLVGFNGPRVNWVIAGGESGRGARPMHPDWARWLRDECQAAYVPFFFKQNGEYVSVSEVAGAGAHHSFPDGTTVRRVGKKVSGAMLDGREWREFPSGERRV